MRGRKNPTPADQPPPNLPPCKVCGEQGTGFHYGVTTCGACKGFFRRSLVRHEPYLCIGRGSCHIGLETKRRKSCPKCRYEKCLEVGMSKGAIKTGRYSYVKKSHDILEMIQHHYQQATSRSSSPECLGFDENKSGKLKSEEFSENLFPSCALGRNSDQGEFHKNKFMELSPLRGSQISEREFTIVESPRSRKNLHDFVVQEVSDMIPSFQNHVPAISGEPTQNELDEANSEHHLPRSPSHWEQEPSSLDLHSRLSSSSSCVSSSFSSSSDASQNFEMEISTNFLYPLQEPSQSLQLTEATAYNGRTQEAFPDDTQHVKYNQIRTVSCYTPVCSVDLNNLKSSYEGSNYMNMTKMDRIHFQNTDELLANSSTQDFLTRSDVIESQELFPDKTGVCDVTGEFHSVSKELENLRRASWEEMSVSEGPPLPDVCTHQSQNDFTKSGINENHCGEIGHQGSSYTYDFLPRYPEPDLPHQELQHWNTKVSPSLPNGLPFDGSRVRGAGLPDCDALNCPIVTEPRDVPVDTLCVEPARHAGIGNICQYQGASSNIQTFQADSVSLKLKQPEQMRSLECCDSAPYHFLSTTANSDESSPKRKKSGHVDTEVGTAVIDLKLKISREINPLPSTLRKFYEFNENFLNLWTPFNLFESPFVEAVHQDECPSRLQPNDKDYNEKPLSWCEFTEAELDDIIMSLKKSHRKYVGLDNNQLTREQLAEKENAFLEVFVFKKVGKGGLPVVSKEVYYEILDATGLDIDGRRSCIQVWTKVMDETLQNTMRFFRSVPGFRDLCLEDKVILSKACIEDYTLLSWFRGVNTTKDVIVHAENKLVIPIAYLLAVLPDIDYFINGTIALSKRLRALELSLEEIIILKAIAIMSPDREQLREYDKVDQIYWRLHCCLILCLSRRHKAPLRHYSKVISVLTDMRQMSADSQSGFRKLKSEMTKLTRHIQVPLYMELFHNVSHGSQSQNLYMK